jgi:hypothetical protein
MLTSPQTRRLVTWFIPCLAVVGLALSAGGCATAKLSQAGQGVEMVHQLNRADCKNLGPVFGKGGGSFGGVWIADERLMEYASNDLRNKAAKKGGNAVVFSTHQMGQSAGGETATATATMTGIAYSCPPHVNTPPGAVPVAPEAPSSTPEGVSTAPSGDSEADAD